MVRNIYLALALMAMAGVASARHSSSLEVDRDSDDIEDHHQPLSAPEIDPSSAMAGLTLMMGGLAVLRGRRRKSA
jgi:LPXTG-motif cell wall-anchored protein